MAKSLRDETPRSSKSRNVVPSYGPGNSLYSATDCLTEDDIKNYFRILPQRSNSSLSQNENRSTKMSNDEKTFEYLRPTSFEDQQKQMRDSTRNQFDRIPFATFHEKFDWIWFDFLSNVRFIFSNRKQFLSIDQKAYAKDYQQRYDQEFLKVKKKRTTKKFIFVLFLVLEQRSSNWSRWWNKCNEFSKWILFNRNRKFVNQ